ncbi:MAG: methionine--tRNA ligase [Candidatus Lernaella stagnicola]|nr:methionine--tRNA ligase [Candidatus Lernaella stagnicola]
MSRRILVTCALPYANGSIHLGHLVEYLFADIWVRYLRMQGEDAIYICADDTHGTAIQVRALKEGTTPEDLIGRMYDEHVKDFADFQVAFDSYHSTNSPENQKWSARIYEAAKAKGLIARREVEQLFCPNDNMFLPDRFVRGTCPKCGAGDQYGDVCEECGTTYNAREVKQPKCSVCGTTPVVKSSEHLFFELGKLTDELLEWTGEDEHLQSEVRNYVNNWMTDGLRDWDISRDGPYFGFPIPGEENKYFYVWLDAPVGYIASTEHYCERVGKNVSDYWENPDTEIYHIIGKDIIYFHALFWPAMLMTADLTLPKQIAVHGFLRVEGEKMSKSRGTFVNARTYLDHLEPEYLRYYYAAKLSGQIEDIDLVFEDFINRVNAELVNKIANLASRSMSFVSKRLGGTLGEIPDDAQDMIAKAEAAGEEIAQAYDRRDLAAAVESITRLAEAGNLYLQEAAPWDAMKKGDEQRARDVCTAAVNLTKIITVYLKPVLPEYAKKVEDMLNLGDLQWSDARADLTGGHEIKPFQHLVERLEREKIDAIIEASVIPEEKTAPSSDFVPEPLSAEIEFDDFLKVDLRVARITAAEAVEGAKKLLRLTLDLGPLGTRSVFAGIAQHVENPESLVGKTIACVANLKPRQMKWGVSEAMITAATSKNTDGKGEHIALVEVPDGKPGERIS